MGAVSEYFCTNFHPKSNAGKVQFHSNCCANIHPKSTVQVYIYSIHIWGQFQSTFVQIFIQKVMQGKCSFTGFLCIQNLHPKSTVQGDFQLLPLGRLSECSSSSRWWRRRGSSSSKLGACWLFTTWPWISDLLL